jgi:hypothetical protein
MLLKREAIYSSKTSVNFYWTAPHHIPDDGILQLLVTLAQS